MRRNAVMKIDNKTLFAVLAKTPDLRADYECQHFVPWFRNKSVLFRSFKPGNYDQT